MLRRNLLKSAAALSLSGVLTAALPTFAATVRRRVRPGDPSWPSSARWSSLKDEVGGRLVKIESPLAACAGAQGGANCAELFHNLRNPFFIGDDPALTQTLGWIDAWTSRPSAYAVAAESSADVAAAVNFARRNALRLVVKGGGHSYLGGSNAPDSLLVWTRHMRQVTLHDAFVPQGCEGRIAPLPAVSLGAGALWLDAYDAVTTKAGRYVQGGGCTTVGVAGLVQGGGFGSFSKGFGTGAAGLLEAEVVTADGVVRVVNARSHPDLFWALKGGGGGTFGVVTRLTLETHELPKFFGAVDLTITAASDAAYRALVEQLLGFYRDNLLNPHWGEQIRFQRGRKVVISMVFQGLDQAGAEATWRPFLDWLAERAGDYQASKPSISAIPARLFWNSAVIKAIPGVAHGDDRPDASPAHFFWSGDAGQVGQVLHAYQSTWLSQRLLTAQQRASLVDALIHAAAGWGVSLHCNKGLAGAPDAVLDRVRDTAMNPAALDAFALAISGAGEGPAYPGVAGHEPQAARGRADAASVRAAMSPLIDLAGTPASYVSETDYFEAEWQTAFWGRHYEQLKAVKHRYDSDGLFFVHHGVGTEGWSSDGFTRSSKA